MKPATLRDKATTNSAVTGMSLLRVLLPPLPSSEVLNISEFKKGQDELNHAPF